MPRNTCYWHASRNNWGKVFGDYHQVKQKKKGKTRERPDICPIKFQMFDPKYMLFLSFFFPISNPYAYCFGRQPDHVQKFSEIFSVPFKNSPIFLMFYKSWTCSKPITLTQIKFNFLKAIVVSFLLPCTAIRS